MKNPLSYVIFTLAAVILIGPRAASAQTPQSIADYRVNIKMESNAELLVTETIVYDFGQASAHGITRNIPYKYDARGGHYNLRLTDIKAVNESGQEYQVKKSFSGNNEIVRIGDPNQTVSGSQTYVISYRVARAVNTFSDHDELYWNAIGGEWSVPILAAEAVVELPPGAAGKIQTACYSGQYGNTGSDCTISGQGGSVSFAAAGPLSPGRGLTIVLGLPKGVIAVPAAVTRAAWVLEDNWILFLPVLAFAVMFAVWRSRGRDPKSKNPVVAQYEPPSNLTPAELAYLVNERTQNRDITAEIIYLAERGYLTITRLESRNFLGFKKSDFRLTKLKNEADLPGKFDRKLMNALFGLHAATLAEALPDDPALRGQTQPQVLISELSKVKNFRRSAGIQDVPDKLVEEGYYPTNPDHIKRNYMLVGIGIVFLSFWLVHQFSLYVMLSLLLTGIIIAVFGFYMPARTEKGADVRQLALGLKEYLSVAEKDRLEFHNDPDKSPERFERLLPYAIALGVTDQWARKFEGVYNQAPRWYSDPYSQTFNPFVLNAFVSDFSGSLNSSIVASASSNQGGGSSAWSGGSGFSGGFSGGGFGGGGGGSW